MLVLSDNVVQELHLVVAVRLGLLLLVLVAASSLSVACPLLGLAGTTVVVTVLWLFIREDQFALREL